MAVNASRGNQSGDGRSALHVFLSVALQVVGSCATFAIVFVIEHNFGLSAQGRFGVLKSWLDVLVTALMFGLPQGLMHLSYQPDSDIGELRGFVRRYVAFVTIAAVIAAVYAQQESFAIGVVILAVPGLVFHGLLRSLLLRVGGLISYALVTIAPAISLFFGVVAVGALGSSRWEWAMVASSLASVLLISVAAAWQGMPAAKSIDVLPAGIWSASLHNFFFNVCVAAQPALLLALLVGWGADPNQLGTLSLSFYFLQVFSVLAGFVAPVVFDRFAAGPSISAVWARDRILGWKILAAAFVGLVVLVLTLPALFSLLFQPSYLVAVDACRVMTAAGGLVMVTRLIATVFLVAGRFSDMSRQAATRVGLSIGIASLGHITFKVELPLAAGYGVLMSELLVAAWGMVVIRRLTLESAEQSRVHRESR